MCQVFTGPVSAGQAWSLGESSEEVKNPIDAATDELVEYFNKTKFKYSLLGLSPIS